MMHRDEQQQNSRRRFSSAEQTRLTLIHTALKLFGEKGFEATATREIARAAKANIGSISYHFGGKEGLRIACADYIVAMMGEVAGAALSQDSKDVQTPEEARAALGQVIESMTGFIVARPEAGMVVQFVLRELSHPTEALDRIYEGIFAPVHKRLCRIWETATGEPAESDNTKLTVFTLIGQLVYFRIANQAVRRRMGWEEIGQSEATAITAVAAANLEAILAARGKGNGTS